jgi:hypothetical protein
MVSSDAQIAHGLVQPGATPEARGAGTELCETRIRDSQNQSDCSFERESFSVEDEGSAGTLEGSAELQIPSRLEIQGERELVDCE